MAESHIILQFWSTFLLLIFKLVFVVKSEIQPPKGITGSVSLVGGDVYQLYWTLDKDLITFEIHVKTFGWVGFGLSPNGGMPDSDVVIGWVKDGQGHLKDCHTTGKTLPVVDDSQDVELIRAMETATHTVLRFRRHLTTCDINDRNVTADTLRVIFAYSDSDPVGEDDFMYHDSNRGAKSVGLLAKHQTPPDIPPDAVHYDFLNTNVTVPSVADTWYWCKGFHVPNFTRKHHLVKIDPIIEEGNEAYVHHVLVLACYHTPGTIDQYKMYPNGRACHHPNMPWAECTVAIFAWAVGASEFYFPPQAGMPFGDVGGIAFLRLEVHYDNPQLKPGIVDSSGLRLWFTPTLRKYDSAMLTTGVRVTSVGQILPSGYKQLTFNGHCTQECLTAALQNETEINVFGNAFHTHLLGVGMKLHHYRNGTELKYLDSDDSYDFNFQETRIIAPEVKIKKGDSLFLECVYSTTSRKTATTAGLGTQQEMCLTFISYYPKINLAGCYSHPTQANIATQLGFKYETFEGTPDQIFVGEMVKFTEGPFTNKTLNEYINTIKQFDEETLKTTYQKALLTGEMRQYCSYRTIPLLPNAPLHRPVPVAKSHYEPTHAPCNLSTLTSTGSAASPSMRLFSLFCALVLVIFQSLIVAYVI